MKPEIVKPDALHGGWGVQFQSKSEEERSHFKQFCWQNFKRLKPFLQGDSQGWVYFEFWAETNENEIKTILDGWE